MNKIHPQEPDRIELARLPTPVTDAPRLARALGVERLLLKRDDLTGVETSGNKIRKLEYVVAEATAAGADTLVTVGGVQSNHCRATAAVAARLGLDCRLLLRSDDPRPATGGNLLLDQLFGAEIRFHPETEFNRHRGRLVQQAIEELQAAGRRPWFVELGASIPTGNWGFIRCVHELVQELGAAAPVDLWCATGSGGTQAGLILGKALFGCQSWNIYGVPVSDNVAWFESVIGDLLEQTIGRFALDVDRGLTSIDLVDGFKGAGYGIPSAAGLELIQTCARYGGLLLDPVYTSKALAGMLSRIRPGGGRAGRIPVFIHTGGVFGLLARPDWFDPA